MKLWGYYAVHTFWNSLKKMFRSTFIIILVAMTLIGGIFGGAIGFMTAVLEDEFTEEQPEAEEREGYGDPEYGYFDETGTFLFYDDLWGEGLGGWDEEGNFIYYEDAYEQGLGYYDEYGDFIFYYEEITEEDMAYIMLVVEAVTAIIILTILFFGAKTGMKQGSDIFMMADVNFLFTAPMKPQSVLLFRLTFQMLAVFAGTLYMLFQIPNMVINLEMSLGACLVIYLALLLCLVLQKLVSVGMYTYTASHEKAKRFVTPVLIGIAAVLLGITVLVYFVTGDFWKTLEYTWSSDWSSLLPIVGWLKAMVMHAVNGNYVAVGIYAALTFAGIVGLTYLVWHIKADFYEDAMAGAQAREDLMQAAAENRKTIEVVDDGKKKKDRRKVADALDPLLDKCNGVIVFLTKELLVRKRVARFGLVTATMMWYFTICTGIALLDTMILNGESTQLLSTILILVLMVVLFFRNYGNPIAQETSMNWLFLVPESPYKKVFFSMMAGTCATALDLLPGFVTAMIMMKLSPATILLWYAVLLTMDFMLSGVGMVLEALFPASAMEMVKSSLQFILKFVVIIFIVAAIVIGVLLGGFELGLILNVILNIVIGIVTFIIYPSKLHEGIA